MKALILISLLVSGCATYYEREYDEGSEYLRSSADEPSAVAHPGRSVGLRSTLRMDST